MQEDEISKGLAAAGLDYRGMESPSMPLIPPRLAAYANSTATEGQEWAASVENDAPDFQERVNHEWYMLCSHRGLFPRQDPQFLIAVQYGAEESSRESWWARVALRTEWDLAGAGAAAQVTGCGWGHPEFVMLSLDGNVIVRGSQGQIWTDFVCLRDPHRIPSFRNMGASLIESKSIPAGTHDAVIRWLEHTATE